MSWVVRAAKCAKQIADGPLLWVTPERSDGGSTLGHLRWMADELAQMRLDSETKACRWLGYLQGSLVALGVSSLDAEKQRNLESGSDEMA